jgi:hypothetical protein
MPLAPACNWFMTLKAPYVYEPTPEWDYDDLDGFVEGWYANVGTSTTTFSDWPGSETNKITFYCRHGDLSGGTAWGHIYRVGFTDANPSHPGISIARYNDTAYARIMVKLNDSTNYFIDTATDFTIFDGGAHIWVIVADGTTGQVKIWLDGSPITTRSWVGTASFTGARSGEGAEVNLQNMNMSHCGVAFADNTAKMSNIYAWLSGGTTPGWTISMLPGYNAAFDKISPTTGLVLPSWPGTATNKFTIYGKSGDLSGHVNNDGFFTIRDPAYNWYSTTYPSIHSRVYDTGTNKILNIRMFHDDGTYNYAATAAMGYFDGASHYWVLIFDWTAGTVKVWLDGTLRTTMDTSTNGTSDYTAAHTDGGMFNVTGGAVQRMGIAFADVTSAMTDFNAWLSAL